MADAVAWSAAAGAVGIWQSAESARRLRDCWLPFVDAYEAGLWIFWMFKSDVVAVPRPAIRTERLPFHREDGPAISWPGGRRHWFWNDVQVPRDVVESPDLITPQRIMREDNIEVRRVMLERYGPARFLGAVRAQPVHSDDCGTLYSVSLPGDEPLVLVKVTNSTPERDGSRKEYFLRVPPHVRTARKAVAWTFGVSDRYYCPRVET